MIGRDIAREVRAALKPDGRSTVSARTAPAERAALAWLLIAVVSGIAFAAISVLVYEQIELPFDRGILATATALGHGGLKLLWEVLSEIGNYPMIPTALVFVAWLYRRKRKREALLVLIVLGVATLANEGVKALVARDRPTGPVPGIPGVIYSYPSGHAWEDVMILGMIAVRLWRSAQAAVVRIGFAVVATTLALVIGLARVALDVHYPSDILAGYLGGLASLGGYAWASRPGSWADHPREPSPRSP
jgi:undecaprenyl-diphosphatase